MFMADLSKLLNLTNVINLKNSFISNGFNKKTLATEAEIPSPSSICAASITSFKTEPVVKIPTSLPLRNTSILQWKSNMPKTPIAIVLKTMGYSYMIFYTYA